MRRREISSESRRVRLLKFVQSTPAMGAKRRPGEEVRSDGHAKAKWSDGLQPVGVGPLK
jgi:hypothetical protein